MSYPFKIINHDFPEDQYYKVKTPKTQIVLHHTASGDDSTGDINWWEKTKEKVATCVLIDRNGTIHTLFSSLYWAHHLGIKTQIFQRHKIPLTYRRSVRTGKLYVDNNVVLNEQTLPVELDSWGWLDKIGNKYYSWAKTEIPKENVIDYGMNIRGHQYYEKYTENQLKGLKYLLKYWNRIYKVPLTYNQNMWNVTKDALTGVPGLYSHVSYRLDKTDCHPQSELISMLKSL